MSSLTSHIKQIPANAGYYITVADARSYFVANNGSDEAPSFGQMISTMSTSGAAVSSLIQTAGGIFKDMGKTLVSASRVFRKVQLVVSTGFVVSGGTSGVGGVDNSPVNYLTGYIELPGQHGSGGFSEITAGASPTPVARLG
jgi:hypothetical protein